MGKVCGGEIMRSSVFPLVWVGKATCCVRVKSDSKERNEAVCVLDKLLQWILKSPVMMKLEQVLARVRKEENSSRNVEKGVE